MTKGIQVLETARNEHEAKYMLEALSSQIGYISGSVLPPANQVGKDTWRVRAFFIDETDGKCWLPDGMRHVIIPDALLKGGKHHG